MFGRTINTTGCLSKKRCIFYFFVRSGLEETMNNTLKEEQTTNKNYRSKTLKDIENEIKKQRAFLVPYTQERIQTTIDLQVKKLHQELLDQRNKEQKKVLIQRSLDFLAPLCCLVLTLFAFWLVWGG